MQWVSNQLLQREWSKRKLSRLTKDTKNPLSHSYIALILNEKKPVTWTFCATMAEVFNESIWELAVKAQLIEKEPPQIADNEREILLLRAFSQLPPEKQDDVLDYVRWTALKNKDN